MATGGVARNRPHQGGRFRWTTMRHKRSLRGGHDNNLDKSMTERRETVNRYGHAD